MPFASADARVAYEVERRRVRGEKIAAGLCTNKGCTSRARPNFKQCEQHARRSLESCTRRRARLARDGLCVACSQPVNAHVRCDDCHAKYLERRLHALAAGRCVECLKRPQDRPNYWSCARCGLRSRVKHRDQRQREASRPQPWRFEDLKWRSTTVSHAQWRRLTGEER